VPVGLSMIVRTTRSAIVMRKVEREGITYSS
jgi:hypothetical protein